MSDGDELARLLQICLQRRTATASTVRLLRAFLAHRTVPVNVVTETLVRPPKTALPDPLWLAVLLEIGRDVGWHHILLGLLGAAESHDYIGKVGAGLQCVANGIAGWEATSSETNALLEAVTAWFDADGAGAVVPVLELTLAILNRLVSGHLPSEGHEGFNTKLTGFLTQHTDISAPLLEGISELHTIVLAQTAGQDMVDTVPTIHARSRLLLYIGALVSHTLLVSDSDIIAYLDAVYRSARMEASADLIIGAFDAQTVAPQAKSFLLKRVPALLAQLVPNEELQSILGRVMSLLQDSPIWPEFVEACGPCDKNPGFSDRLIETCNKKAFGELSKLCRQVCQGQDVQQEVLEPLVCAIDAWTLDDEVDVRAAYEEFGTLVLCFLSLDNERKPIGHGFCREYRANLDKYTGLAMLSKPQAAAFEGWLSALYDNAGISDDLLHSLPPPQVYLMLSTLFSQSAHACMNGTLDITVAIEGFEYFCSPFLIPSLVGPLLHLADLLWVHRSDVLVQLLRALIETPNLAEEHRWMHETVLQLVAAPLDAALAQLSSHEIAVSLRTVLQPMITPHAAMPHDLLAALREQVASLTLWSSMQNMSQQMPPPDIHPLLLEQCLQIHGSRLVFDVLFAAYESVELESGEFAADTVAAFLTLPVKYNGMKLTEFLDTSHPSNAVKRLCSRLETFS